MEKDYFKDRPRESTCYTKILTGMTVYICEKEAQRYAKKIDDLTRGVVVEKLTSHDHPRGIKVKIKDDDGALKVGRIVYIDGYPPFTKDCTQKETKSIVPQEGHVYVTGDTHGDFSHILSLQEKYDFFTPLDTLIILGDSGFNYYVSKNLEENGRKYISKKTNQKRKQTFLQTFPGTVFCIHGNHEARPETIEGYLLKEWNGGMVYYEKELPRLLFGIDGEIYDLCQKKYMVIGGAYSVDKYYRLQRNIQWFDDEMASPETEQRVEKVLEKNNWKIHGILSHTCPIQYIPREMFLASVDQSTVDNSMEKWLGELERRCEYDVWYFGHFHGNKHIDKMIMLFHDVEELK